MAAGSARGHGAAALSVSQLERVQELVHERSNPIHFNQGKLIVEMNALDHEQRCNYSIGRD